MEVLQNLINQTAFFNGSMDWRSYVMILVAFIFLYLAIKKGYEPLLLIQAFLARGRGLALLSFGPARILRRWRWHSPKESARFFWTRRQTPPT